jgi:hypothetical protein
MTGERDDLDNEISEVLYEGKCDYQEGGQTYRSVLTRNDVAYLPSNDVIIEENDIVEVVTPSGRVIRSVVEKVRDIIMEYSGEKLTKMELKQAKQK